MAVYEVTWTIKHTRVIEADSEKEAIWFSEKMGVAGHEAIQNGHDVPRRIYVSRMKAKVSPWLKRINIMQGERCEST